MKSEKENHYIRTILRLLLQKETVVTSQIAEMISLSEKATRNKLEHVQNYLLAYKLGSIEKKPRVGVWLQADANQREQLWQFIDRGDPMHAGYTSLDRVHEALRLFFRMLPRESIATQRLADELYVSPPTVLKIIKECMEWLRPYHIQIMNQRNRGYALQCEEANYRIACKDSIMDEYDNEKTRKNMQIFFSNIDIEVIKKAIIETENEWNYRFTDASFYEVLIYCVFAYQRRDVRIPKPIKQEDQAILERYNEYPFTIAIFKKLHERLHIIFSNEDVLFLATQILGSKFIGVNNQLSIAMDLWEYDKKMLDFIDEMLLVIGNILETDLMHDQKLKESLVFHMRPTIFRLRYGSPQSNSLVSFIKTEYKRVFRATWSISILFEKYFHLQISEDEIGYIVLYIQCSLERQQHQYRALQLSQSNSAHAQLLSQRIRKVAPEISDLAVISYHDFKLNEHEECDIIISSHELQEKDKRIVVIPNLLSEGGISTLRSFIDHLNLRVEQAVNPFAPICFQLFSPELMFTHVDFITKEDVLAHMCESMEKKGYVTHAFFASVMERENATTTSIGNGVALPHGAMRHVIDSHVAIAVLKSPILWDEEEIVDIIFLLAFKMETHEEIRRIQSFYKQYISLIETDDKVKLIRNKATNIELYQYLIQ